MSKTKTPSFPARTPGSTTRAKAQVAKAEKARPDRLPRLWHMVLLIGAVVKLIDQDIERMEADPNYRPFRGETVRELMHEALDLVDTARIWLRFRDSVSTARPAPVAPRVLAEGRMEPPRPATSRPITS
jgi:hypothetical protein